MISGIKEVESSDAMKKLILTVNFVGDNTHAELSLDKVAKYNENYEA